MATNDRLLLLAGVVAGGLGLSLITTPPLLWALAGSVILTACVGADQMIHAHWRQQRRRRRYDLALWIFPAVVVAGGFLVLRLPFFESGTAVALGVAAATGLFVAVVICQLHSLSPEDRHYRLARFVLSLLAYLTAFGMYSAIYAPRGRSLYSATAVVFVTVLVCLELFRGHAIDGRRALLYAGVLGLAVGEVTWALNYWLISPLAGGLLLLAALYVGAGIVQSHLAARLTPRTALEFVAVGAGAVGLVAGAALISS